MAKTCYMCDEKATSVEHVPPKGLFPESQRKLLITVPACDKHNMDTSRDDEHLRNVLTMCIGGNSSGAEQFFNKTKKVYDHSQSLREKLKENSTPVIIEDVVTSEKCPTVATKFEASRVLGSFDKIGRALYFNHFNKKFANEIDVVLEFARDINKLGFNKKIESLIPLLDLAFSQKTFHGNNPEVFKYQVCDDVGLMMRLTFYEAQLVSLIFKP